MATGQRPASGAPSALLLSIERALGLERGSTCRCQLHLLENDDSPLPERTRRRGRHITDVNRLTGLVGHLAARLQGQAPATMEQRTAAAFPMRRQVKAEVAALANDLTALRATDGVQR